MDVAISGASGLVGSALTTRLKAEGHRPIALVRRTAAGADEISWDPGNGTVDASSLEGIDAVVHLAGAPIGDKRWSDDRKTVIRHSRTNGTAVLATALAGLDRAPKAFVSGSAIGYYGSRGDEILTEQSSSGDGFLADVCVAWERAASPAVEAGIRTCFARTGIVLSADGGALKKQLPLFKLGLGGRMGSGTQWLGWVSIADEVAALIHLIETDVHGPVNITAPNPCTNLEFTKALGKELGRPTLLPVPLAGPKLLFGSELVEELLLGSQRVSPTVLVDTGFVHRHSTIEAAFADLVG